MVDDVIDGTGMLARSGPVSDGLVTGCSADGNVEMGEAATSWTDRHEG
jgi:hypothetical protein